MKKTIFSMLIAAIMLFPVGCSKENSNTGNNNSSGEINETAAVVEYADKYIDLHLHLDGALTTDIAKELAQIQGIELPTEDDAELTKLLTVPPDCTSLNDFLECFDFPLSLMQTETGLREAVKSVLDNIGSQGLSMQKYDSLRSCTPQTE